MTQITTNYTTYDQAYYYADLHRLPRLSDEEQRTLIASTPSSVPRLDIQTRNRLIEAHLPLAKRIAIDTCPPAYYGSLPDIIGEVNLALIKAGNAYDAHAGGNLRSYFIAYAEKAVKRAMAADRLIRIPSSTFSRARAKGTQQQLSQLQPESLDVWMEWFHTDDLEEPPASPLLPTQAAPPRNPSLRAQVQGWLAYLSPREQAVLRLRYGLGDDDERAYSVAEIASSLRLKRPTVEGALKSALRRLKALGEGRATLIERKGQSRISGIYTFKPPTLTAEQDSALTQAALHLAEQGVSVTGRRLAQETGLAINRAQVFLRAHRDEFPGAAHARQVQWQERLRRLEEACQHLQAQGVQVTIERLASAAHIRKETVADFLRTRRGDSSGGRRQVFRCTDASKEERIQERHERLAEAFGQLSAQHGTVSANRLARTAHVGKESAIAFVRARKEETYAAR